MRNDLPPLPAKKKERKKKEISFMLELLTRTFGTMRRATGTDIAYGGASRNASK